jgi:hypothetical protein
MQADLAVDGRLDFESGYRVCAARSCVGVSRHFKENRVRHGIRSGGIGDGPTIWARTGPC